MGWSAREPCRRSPREYSSASRPPSRTPALRWANGAASGAVFAVEHDLQVRAPVRELAQREQPERNRAPGCDRARVEDDPIGAPRRVRWAGRGRDRPPGRNGSRRRRSGAQQLGQPRARRDAVKAPAVALLRPQRLRRGRRRSPARDPGRDRHAPCSPGAAARARRSASRWPARCPRPAIPQGSVCSSTPSAPKNSSKLRLVTAAGSRAWRPSLSSSQTETVCPSARSPSQQAHDRVVPAAAAAEGRDHRGDAQRLLRAGLPGRERRRPRPRELGQGGGSGVHGRLLRRRPHAPRPILAAALRTRRRHHDSSRRARRSAGAVGRRGLSRRGCAAWRSAGALARLRRSRASGRSKRVARRAKSTRSRRYRL